MSDAQNREVYKRVMSQRWSVDFVLFCFRSAVLQGTEILHRRVFS